MMGEFKSFLLCGVISLICFQISAQVKYEETNGQDLNHIQTAVPFLTIAPDSRASGMGDVGVATSPDINSMHWNPSKYAFIEGEYGVCLSYTPWLKKLVNDINLYYLIGYYRFDKRQVISGSLLYFNLGQIQFTSITGDPLRTGEPNEFAIDVAYSRMFADKVSGSVAFRYIRSDLSNGVPANDVETSAGNAYAVDVSMFYQSKVKLGDYKGKMAYGLDISNVGSKISYTETDEYFIPINLRLGSTITLDLDDYNSLAFSLDLNKLLVPTTPIEIDTLDDNGNTVTQTIGKGDLNASVPVGIFKSFSDAPGVDMGDGTRSVFREEMREINIGFGLEYWYAEQFAIRGGYFYEHATKGNRKYFTVGLGLKYNVFGLDLSYIIPQYPNNPLANTIRFTLVFNFEPGGTNSNRR